MRALLVLLTSLVLVLASPLAEAGQRESAARGPQLPPGVKSGVPIKRLTMDAKTGVTWAAQGIRKSTKDVVAEVFRVTEPNTVAAIGEARQNGRAVRANADPENIDYGPQPALRALGVELKPWGGAGLNKKGNYDAKVNPRKVHAKAVHYGDEDGEDESWASTSPLIPRAEDTFDVSAIITGKASRAGRAITERLIEGDMPGFMVAAAKGRKHGVLVNNAAAGVTYLTDGMEDLIKNAKEELIVGVKLIESPSFARLLAKAAKRGVKVTLITPRSRMSSSAKAIIKKSDVIVAEPNSVMHGNIVMADRSVAIFGSAHPTSRGLGLGSSRRESHEMGFVVDDPKAIGKMHSRLLELGAATKH
jgi:hypothetical protein